MSCPREDENLQELVTQKNVSRVSVFKRAMGTIESSKLYNARCESF